jgi:hypothetical protein
VVWLAQLVAASCSSRGRVTFDLGLLVQPESFRREVVVHVLLHLKVPNHGPPVPCSAIGRARWPAPVGGMGDSVGTTDCRR